MTTNCSNTERRLLIGAYFNQDAFGRSHLENRQVGNRIPRAGQNIVGELDDQPPPCTERHGSLVAKRFEYRVTRIIGDSERVVGIVESQDRARGLPRNVGLYPLTGIHIGEGECSLQEQQILEDARNDIGRWVRVPPTIVLFTIRANGTAAGAKVLAAVSPVNRDAT